uniref:Uncharacterized protein n=1 Tax=Arundo donax TaxID=35708 RepID=A0A0A9GPU0_ARUDO
MLYLEHAKAPCSAIFNRCSRSVVERTALARGRQRLARSVANAWAGAAPRLATGYVASFVGEEDGNSESPGQRRSPGSAGCRGLLDH